MTIDLDAPGVLRGACPKCLGPARSVYARIDVLEAVRGAASVRGIVFCLDTEALVSVRGYELPASSQTSEEVAPYTCSTCGGSAASLNFQLEREWRTLVDVEVCLKERLVRNLSSGRSIPIPRPVAHDPPRFVRIPAGALLDRPAPVVPEVAPRGPSAPPVEIDPDSI